MYPSRATDARGTELPPFFNFLFTYLFSIKFIISSLSFIYRVHINTILWLQQRAYVDPNSIVSVSSQDLHFQPRCHGYFCA